MTDAPLEDHAVGVELQITELVEQRARAIAQGDHERAAALEAEVATLQEDLVETAERIADDHPGGDPGAAAR